ncbi:hypothetical protein M427DRAFT_155230 [Gonapodya prolifera JEL478]|uniref:Uncharacterized protein n=1 Tax=Gonapodya prolifera (strain JEL478) TaxID=1344416 RepID=A0A139AH48_GONPJ|nr:hypothetical protein M427DRAFT_155230 [Gonapodya prolifera JEL478]|eukprot:KXS15765.1 hypothetical protein M427DRAFT_155230 [Gonapodya prolifera JEL478]
MAGRSAESRRSSRDPARKTQSDDRALHRWNSLPGDAWEAGNAGGHHSADVSLRRVFQRPRSMSLDGDAMYRGCSEVESSRDPMDFGTLPAIPPFRSESGLDRLATLCSRLLLSEDGNTIAGTSDEVNIQKPEPIPTPRHPEKSAQNHTSRVPSPASAHQSPRPMNAAIMTLQRRSRLAAVRVTRRHQYEHRSISSAPMSSARHVFMSTVEESASLSTVTPPPSELKDETMYDLMQVDSRQRTEAPDSRPKPPRGTDLTRRASRASGVLSATSSSAKTNRPSALVDTLRSLSTLLLTESSRPNSSFSKHHPAITPGSLASLVNVTHSSTKSKTSGSTSRTKVKLCDQPLVVDLGPYDRVRRKHIRCDPSGGRMLFPGEHASATMRQQEEQQLLWTSATC